MLDRADVLRLQELLELRRNKSPTILGALIGDIVKKEFSKVQIKSDYGSIRKLIESELPGFLQFHSKHGKDNEYIFLKTSVLPTQQNQASNDISPGTISGNQANSNIQQDLSDPSEKLVAESKIVVGSDELLRQAIKASIDAMTPEQLRQLVIPAGIFFDAIKFARG